MSCRAMPQCHPCFLLAILLACAATAGTSWGGESASALSISDMMKVRHLHEQSLSPDGRRIAYVVAEADFKRNAYRFTLHMLDIKSGAVRVIEDGEITQHPCWTPDSSTVAFLRGEGNTASLQFLNVNDNTVRVLSAQVPRRANCLVWSPQGDVVSFLAPAEDKKARQTPVDTIYETEDSISDSLMFCTASTGTASTGTVKLACKNPGHVTEFAWSPDGKQIAFARQPSSRKSDADHSDLWLLDVDKGTCTPLVQQPGADTQPQWSPDGVQVAFFSKCGQSDYFQDYVPCMIPSAGGAITRLIDDADLKLSFDLKLKPTYSADKKSIYVLADRGLSRHLFQIDLASRTAKQVTEALGVYRTFSFSADRTFMSFAFHSAQLPADLFVTAPGAFKPKRVVELNPQLAEKSLSDASIVRWKSDDGMELEGVLFKPHGSDATGPFPLITCLHGGPPSSFHYGFAPEISSSVPQAGFCPVHVLTGRGYAVFCPNPRGSDGYGRSFRETVKARWGEDDLRDVLSGIDNLQKTGVADPKRLALTGYCYGAYLSLRALTRTDRFSAAFLGGTFGDTAAVYGQTEVPELFEAYFGGPPWEQRDKYDKCSPMLDAHRIRTPVFLVHAKQDKRVPWSQSKQLHTILTRVGTPTEMMTYPRGDHTVLESRMHAETMRLQVMWFDRWLKETSAK
ncbi:MAG: S9 family peptidase [Planctomycetota bacterium]|nr:S9 family peptidase [Planctomycetota bacterium]